MRKLHATMGWADLLASLRYADEPFYDYNQISANHTLNDKSSA
jgi:hypothetical protein